MLKMPIALVCILLFSCLKISLYGGNPLKQGLPPAIYYNAEKMNLSTNNQNWAIKQAPNGFMYFANSAGLLQYDGKEWKIYNSSSSLRSMHIEPSGRIYTGETKQFGYFEPNSRGEMHYRSLSKQIDSVGIIWNIVSYNGAIYFISYQNRMFKYDNGSVTEIKLPPTFRRFKGFVVNQELLLFDMNAGLAVVKNDTVYRFHTETLEQPIFAYSILPLDREQLVLGARYRGLYTINYKQLIPLDYQQSYTKDASKKRREDILTPDGSILYSVFQTDINEELASSELYESTELANGTLAYVTLKNGMYIIDKTGKLLDHFSMEKGLPDNNALAVLEDKDLNLWVSTNQGITLFELNNGFREFNATHNITGTFYTYKIIDNKLFIATSNGLFFIDLLEQNNHQTTHLFPEHNYVTALYEHNDGGEKNLIYMSLQGTYYYRIKTGKLTKIHSAQSGKAIMQYPTNKSIFLISHVNGITVLKKRENRLIFDSLTTILPHLHSINNIKFDSNHILYITSTRGYVPVAAKLDPQNFLKQPQYVTYDTTNGLPIATRYEWLLMDNAFCLSAGYKLYKMQNSTNELSSDTQFAPYNTINQQLQPYRFTISSLLKSNEKILIGTSDGILVYDEKEQSVSRGNFYKIANQTVFDINKIEERVWIVLRNRLIYFDETQVTETENKTGLMFSRIEIGQEPLLSVMGEHTVKAGAFSHNRNSLFAQVAYPTYGGVERKFSFFLEGLSTEWTHMGVNNTYIVSYLPAGNYTLKAKALDGYGKESETILLHFTISLPFYLKWYAICMYILVLAAIVWLSIKIYARKLKQEQIKLQKAVDQATYLIKEQNEEIKQQSEEIVLQRDALFAQNRDILDSIEYARKIQRTVLKAQSMFSDLFPESFTINTPKDIVSGDFYWSYANDEYKILAVADCTGHGVPGAFMSILGVNFLREIVIDQGIYMPNEILDKLRRFVISALRQTEDSINKDGMDITLITIHKTKKIIYYAGANSPIYVADSSLATSDENHLKKYAPDKMPIGIHTKKHPFTLNTITIEGTCRVYMQSDGYYDQYGKATDKKITSKKYMALLAEIQHLSMAQQKNYLVSYLENWKGNVPQTDDILVVGIELAL